MEAHKKKKEEHYTNRTPKCSSKKRELEFDKFIEFSARSSQQGGKLSNRFEARGGERKRGSGGPRAGGWSMRTHRKYVEERDEEERWVRPAGSRGGPERRQHERRVVYHRHLRDIHRRGR